MRRVYTDRSRVETYQRCKRLRFLEYHFGGMGIRSARFPLPLAVGISTHCGLESLLRGETEDSAVAAALADFQQYTLDPPDAERQQNAVPDFDDYLKAEQAALVEALVRAYARRRLRPLLEQFEVLEVEREGSWLLSEWFHGERVEGSEPRDEDGVHLSAVGRLVVDRELWFMSRPDALLRERQSNELYILSYKTTGSWDARKARDAEHDMQGLSEGVEVERRLTGWWQEIQHKIFTSHDYEPWAWGKESPSPAMFNYLRELPAPPRILGIRYEYLLKGERWRDKDLSQRFGFDARVQRSHLIRGYLNAGMAAGDEQWNHAWEYLKPDGSGETSKLNYRAWHSEPVWTHMPIAKWIDMLDDAAMLSVEGADRGYQSSAQATGTTATHPLDDVFIPPMVVYRQDDELRDLVEQIEYQEREVAEHVAQIEAASDEGERRSLLNRFFSQSRRACQFPTQCAMVPVCFGGSEIKRDPLGSGLYQIRKVNHRQELEGRE